MGFKLREKCEDSKEDKVKLFMDLRQPGSPRRAPGRCSTARSTTSSPPALAQRVTGETVEVEDVD
jgi:hypothetical protein